MTRGTRRTMTAAATPGARIEIRGLTKRFGSFVAVDDLSFDVEPGRITGFLGPNGSGKTTTLRMLLGLVHASSGTATIDGSRYVDLPHRWARRRGSRGDELPPRPEWPRPPAGAGRRRLGAARRRVDELLELTGIPAAARKRAGEYSMGMRQRLGLAAALLGDPRVLVLDEPANGLDPEGIRWLRGFLRHLSNEGKTILISSHQLQEVEQTVDDVIIIANGRLVRSGPIAELHGTSGAMVSTSDPARLAGALRVADVTSTVHRRTARSSPTPPTCASWATWPCGPACRSTAWRTSGPTSRPCSSADRGNQPQRELLRGRGAPERDAVTGQEGANQ